MKLIFPPVLVEHFDLLKMKKRNDGMHFYFEEKRIPPAESFDDDFVSKGFCAEVIIDHFPVNGQLSFLHITKIRWMNKKDGSIIKRNRENLVTKIISMQNSVDFSKEISQ